MSIQPLSRLYLWTIILIGLFLAAFTQDNNGLLVFAGMAASIITLELISWGKPKWRDMLIVGGGALAALLLSVARHEPPSTWAAGGMLAALLLLLICQAVNLSSEAR